MLDYLNKEEFSVFSHFFLFAEISILIKMKRRREKFLTKKEERKNGFLIKKEEIGTKKKKFSPKGGNFF